MVYCAIRREVAIRVTMKDFPERGHAVSEGGIVISIVIGLGVLATLAGTLLIASRLHTD